MKSSIKGIAPEWYTIEGEEDEAEPVQFYLKPLDGFGSMEVSMLSMTSTMGGMIDGVRASSEVLKTAFRLGVRDWRNIEDADNPGQPLKFSAAAMASLRPGWIMEAGARVLEISNLGAVREKNSDSPSSSPATEQTSPA